MLRSGFDDEGNLDADDVDRFCSAHITYVVTWLQMATGGHGGMVADVYGYNTTLVQ